jgi:hypothetical protein
MTKPMTKVVWIDGVMTGLTADDPIPANADLVGPPTPRHVWQDGAWVLPDMDLQALQADLIRTAKDHADTLITASGHDRYAARKVRTGQDIPPHIVAYADSVVAACDLYEVEVMGKLTPDAAVAVICAWPVLPGAAQ